MNIFEVLTRTRVPLRAGEHWIPKLVSSIHTHVASDDLEAQVKNRDVKAGRPKSAPPKTKRSIDAVAGSKASSAARKAVKSSKSSNSTL